MRSRLAMTSVLCALLAAVSLGATAPTTAGAAAQVSEPTTVSNCLDGHSPPQDFVYDVNRLSHQIRLFCGDYTKGILKIEDQHPGIDNTNFIACINLIFSAGNPGPKQSNGNYQWTGLYLKGGKYQSAYAIVTESSYISGEWSVLTAYTNLGSSGNDWTACGTYARSVGYTALHLDSHHYADL